MSVRKGAHEEELRTNTRKPANIIYVVVQGRDNKLTFIILSIVISPLCVLAQFSFKFFIV